MESTSKKRMVSCPACGEPSLFNSDNPYRPFCSQRCKMIDLGQWASEEYRIPETTPPADEFDLPEE